MVDALDQDVRIIQRVAFGNMMCLAYMGDKQLLNRLLVYSNRFDMVANSTYHADVDRMDNMGLVNRLDSAFDDAMAENNDLVTVWLMEFVAEVVDLVLIVMEFEQPMDNGTCVKVLKLQKRKNIT